MDFSAMDYAKVTNMVQIPRGRHIQEITTVEFMYHTKEYPQLSERAKKTFLSFPATYLCVSAFLYTLQPKRHIVID